MQISGLQLAKHLVAKMTSATLTFLSLSPLLCSDEAYVIGFVVPNQKQLLALANQYSIRGSFEELCNNKAIEELVLKAITEAALAGERQQRGR